MATERIPGFCALCRSRCGCISVVARLNGSLAADVVCAQFGWWQACEPLSPSG